jgi:hypothetical protein
LNFEFKVSPCGVGGWLSTYFGTVPKFWGLSLIVVSKLLEGIVKEKPKAVK